MTNTPYYRSSTLENWCREFARFTPSISIQTYYAGKDERPALRQTLIDTQRRRGKNDTGWEVLITTYNLAQGNDRDRKFFRRVEWDVSMLKLLKETPLRSHGSQCIVFDEGHVLKNFQSQRYQALLKFEARWRLLLTGTPLQNNLQELVVCCSYTVRRYWISDFSTVVAQLYSPQPPWRDYGFVTCDFQNKRRCQSRFTLTGAYITGKEDDDTLCPSATEGSSTC